VSLIYGCRREADHPVASSRNSYVGRNKSEASNSKFSRKDLAAFKKFHFPRNMYIFSGAHSSLLFSGYQLSFPRLMSGALPLFLLYANMCLFVAVVLVAHVGLWVIFRSLSNTVRYRANICSPTSEGVGQPQLAY
jgi:hypothetical protein